MVSGLLDCSDGSLYRLVDLRHGTQYSECQFLIDKVAV